MQLMVPGGGNQMTLRGQSKESLAAKTDCHDEVVVPFCGCGVAIVSYDTQVVQCNTPITPQLCETFPQLITMIKWYSCLVSTAK